MDKLIKIHTYYNLISALTNPTTNSTTTTTTENSSKDTNTNQNTDNNNNNNNISTKIDENLNNNNKALEIIYKSSGKQYSIDELRESLANLQREYLRSFTTKMEIDEFKYQQRKQEVKDKLKKGITKKGIITHYSYSPIFLLLDPYLFIY